MSGRKIVEGRRVRSDGEDILLCECGSDCVAGVGD